MITEPVLTLKNLIVRLPVKDRWLHAVDGIDLQIYPGEIFALVGESGCGKSMTAAAIARLLPLQAQLLAGSEMWLSQTPLHQLSEHEMSKIRAKRIGLIFQDPMASLNPVMSIGDQLAESIQFSGSKPLPSAAIKAEAIALLKSVRIPDPERMLGHYPHQLSGGMKQRVVIAMALAKKPDLLIADEPTTALDVTTQAQVLHLLQTLNQTHHVAILLITHDLGVVAQMADKVAVMYAGHIVEQTSTRRFFADPMHPYSAKLLRALPEKSSQSQRLSVIAGQIPDMTERFTLCRFKSRCPYQFKLCEEQKPQWIDVEQHHQVRCHWHDQTLMQGYPKAMRLKVIQSMQEDTEKSHEQLRIDVAIDDESPLILTRDFKVHFPIKQGILKRTVGYVKAVDGVDIAIHEGETLALVGESGCGKTSMGKAVLRLIDAQGEYLFDQTNMLRLKGRKLRRKRADVQMIFQDPYSSMNPKMRVHDILEEGMISLRVGSDRREREDRIDVLLSQVGLSSEMKWRYPFEFSGGQRQRIAIARALAVGPRLIVCDEPTSALDVSVQAQILNLLKDIQAELGISYLFITHNINVVQYIAQRIAVMYLGRIVETGTAVEVLTTPKHPYTQALLDSVPSSENLKKGFHPPKGEVPSLLNPPKGCHFAPRCPHKMPICEQIYPQSFHADGQQWISCYLYQEKQANKEHSNGQSG